MRTKQTLYLYPFTKATTREGGNTYIPNLLLHLGRHFKIVNKQTSRGLADVLFKMPMCDVLYFNWIEDVADKRFGALQVFLLAAILSLSKLTNKKIVWFVHNNLSHKKGNQWLKKQVVRLMKKHADIVLSHSREAKVAGLKQGLAVFDHPVDAYQPLPYNKPHEYDFLIWGTVTPYKGVEEFLTFNRTTNAFNNYKILIAGKFASPEYFETIQQLKTPNTIIENKVFSEEELKSLFSKSQYVLFTYNATSVLSSAALSKTLSYGKTIIGPAVGAFKELGAKDLIYTYDSFEDLKHLVPDLAPKELQPAYQHQLQTYLKQHSWPQFADFAAHHIYKKEPLVHNESYGVLKKF